MDIRLYILTNWLRTSLITAQVDKGGVAAPGPSGDNVTALKYGWSLKSQKIRNWRWLMSAIYKMRAFLRGARSDGVSSNPVGPPGCSPHILL